MTHSEFCELSEVFLPRLLRTGKRRWGDEGEDIIQEAFLRAFEARKLFDHSCSFSTWIFGYAVNVAHNNRRGNLDIDCGYDVNKAADNATPESYTLAWEIEILCEMLPPARRKALRSKLDGLPYDRQNLLLARRELKQLLEIDDEE